MILINNLDFVVVRKQSSIYQPCGVVKRKAYTFHFVQFYYPLYLSTTMASFSSSSSSSILPSLTSTLSSSKPSIPFNFSPFTKTSKRVTNSVQILKAQTLEFSGSFFEGGFGENNDEPPTTPWSGISAVEDKEEPQCPPGLRPYETMAVLRPDMSEDERLALTQKYEELLVAGGGMYVEVFNRGVIPLAYSIRRKNKAGETNTYLDGIYLLFTYFTKPESIAALEATLIADDDVIRSSTFKIRKRKY